MTAETHARCGVCKCFLDEEDLFCANCGTENSLADHRDQKLKHVASHHGFGCTACGASMNYDASAKALRCPFCGSTKMEKREGARTVTPERVVPFQIDEPNARRILKEWLGSGFWRPADAARGSTIGEMVAVYVPYWMFRATTDTFWTADSSPAPRGSQGEWYPVSGSNQSKYSGILIGGSSILTPEETNSIAPFNADSGVAPGESDLLNTTSEDFRVPRKLARPIARAAVERFERNACAKKVPNRSRNLRVNVRLSDVRGLPVLLPVWVLAYRYKEKVHRVLINGQTGKIAGTAPFSYGKLTFILLVVIGVIATIVLVATLANLG